MRFAQPDLTAPVALDSATVVAAATGSTLTISGGISGSGSLALSGQGALVLSGANSYSGGTIVSGGTLYVTTAVALPEGQALTVGAGAAMLFGGVEAGSGEQGAGSEEQGAGSGEQGAGSVEQGAWSGEQTGERTLAAASVLSAQTFSPSSFVAQPANSAPSTQYPVLSGKQPPLPASRFLLPAPRSPATAADVFFGASPGGTSPDGTSADDRHKAIDAVLARFWQESRL